MKLICETGNNSPFTRMFCRTINRGNLNMEPKKKLLAGIKQFNDQHKELIRIISELRSSKKIDHKKPLRSLIL
jgi:hypothetical protein